MKHDIILAGVGGQGILSIAAILDYAAIAGGYHLKQAEVHGMSRRGGDVQSHLRISDTQIYSDLIPTGGADIVLSVEPLESLRYLSFLAPEGRLITNVTPEENIPDYPTMETVLARIAAIPGSLTVDADAIAKELGHRRGMNMVMTGLASLFLELDFELLQGGVRHVFGRKGDDVVRKNIQALEAGRDYAAGHVDGGLNDGGDTP